MRTPKLSEAREISSLAELERLRADRENDQQHLELNHPRPSWAESDPEHPRRVHMRMRERRINILEKRLGLHDDQARSEFERSGEPSRTAKNDNEMEPGHD